MAKSLASIKAQLAKIEEQKKALVIAERTAQRETIFCIGKLVTETPNYLTSAGMAAVKKHFPEFEAIKKDVKLEAKPVVKYDLQQIQVSVSQERTS